MDLDDHLDDEAQQFSVGDKVRWATHGGKIKVQKQGEVVYVLKVSEGHHPVRIAKSKFPEHTHKFTGLTIPGGNRVGYLVSVPGDGDKSRPKLYMPFPTKLQLV